MRPAPAWCAALGLCVTLLPGSLPSAEFTQLTASPAGSKTWNSEPAWSPDGKRIAYTHATLTPDNEFSSWIEVVAAHGGKPGRFPGQDTGVKPLANTHPSWSPDGTRLVFSAASGLMVTSGAASPTLLFHGPLLDAQPVWSPDGSWIVFESEASGIRALYRQPSIGGAAELVSPPKGPMSGAAWSPDGNRLACAIWGENGRDVWILPLHSGNWRSVTRDAAEDWAPAWSPDGRTLAFVSNRSGNRDLWLVAVQGGDAVQLTDDPGDDLDPCWSPDGKHLAFASSRSGTLQIWIASDLPPASVLERSWRAPKSIEP